ncbi:MAG TPA: DNA replication and repair protein RecF [Gemmatimonadaceae bacterium]
MSVPLADGSATLMPDAVRSAPAARLRRLTIRDFRNLAAVTLELPDSGLAFVGDNGHGKTNLLEAVYYLHLFRSMRGARDRELVRFGAAAFHVAASAEGTRWQQVGAGFERETGRRRIILDGVPCPRVGDALGAVPSVAFSPADVSLVAGGPGGRRQWLDVVLASTSPRYLAALREYRAALAQRNAALRARTRSSPPHVWDVPLAMHGAALTISRAAFLTWGTPLAAQYSDDLGERGTLELRYRTGESLPPGATEDEVRDGIASALHASRERDLERGVTHHGPHRDDVDLRLSGVSLRRYGSAGQQRTAAIALRLLECAWHREHGGREPLLLLDDPVAELDRRRAARVLELLTDEAAGQVLLAVPRDDDIPSALTALPRRRVRDGAVEPGDA